ncbi:MAG: hypothetical protein U0575_05405 [Phycisphaerales bacterium]
MNWRLALLISVVSWMVVVGSSRAFALAYPSGANAEDPPVEPPKIELYLPLPLTRAEWDAALDKLALVHNAALNEAYDVYRAGWEQLAPSISELNAGSAKAAMTRGTEQAAMIAALFARSTAVVEKSIALNDALFVALRTVTGEDRASEVDKLLKGWQRAQAYRVLSRMQVWPECGIDPSNVIDDLERRQVDLSQIRSVIDQGMVGSTSAVLAAARAGREAIVKDQSIMADYQANVNVAGAEALLKELMDRRKALWQELRSAAKSLKSTNRAFVDGLVQALQEPNATLVREAFQEQWYPHIYAQKKSLQLMFAKAKEVEGGSKEYVEFADACEREFNRSFDVAAIKAIRVDDEWIERRLQQQPIPKADFETFRQTVDQLKKERDEIGRQSWTKVLGVLDPEKRATLEAWMSPTGKRP